MEYKFGTGNGECLAGTRPKCLSNCRLIPDGLVTVISLGRVQQELQLLSIVRVCNSLSDMTSAVKGEANT